MTSQHSCPSFITNLFIISVLYCLYYSFRYEAYASAEAE
ncbi:hypothetical protein Hsw_0714 [Hymenobacter swuensis DY53]|uniref:Uncharacterized protein n=1 Tax=Hymenobacter swuensis DY53 TaxID=1227739 RepID=W8ET13_9BACT|nr:hypothetical protein Hsw_0714 [Hymenobacter swuensis DY53]